MAESPIELNFADCTAVFKPRKNYEYPNRLRYLNGVAQHPTLGEIATMRCLVVSRRDVFKTHGDFLEILDSVSDEILQFAKGLFDAHSNVRPWLVDGGYRSGSGCWGKELSRGDILYIQDLTVKEQVRGRGVGSWILKQLLQSPFIHALQGKAHIFCWPMPPWIPFDDDNSRSPQKIAQVNRFFHKNGFRRVGRTSFFGYSLDPNHPSRRVPIEDDPGLLGDDFPDVIDDIDPESDYPLHFAVTNIKTPEISAILTAAHARDPEKIHQPDFMGFTPLYIAAGSRNLHALRTLLDLGVAGELRNTSNKDHMTPLEKLQDTMRDTREFVETMGLSDKGYSEEELACEYLLKKALGLRLIAESERDYIVKRRFGCTCGSCTDQWLSPRMRFHLQSQAEACYSSMARDFDSARPNESGAHEIPSLNYLPLALRNQMRKPFYQGYRSLFSGIAHILKNAANGIPTPARVRSQALHTEPSVHFYISEGGRVEYALDAIIDIATQRVFGDDENDALREASDVGDGGLVDMPMCANDLAFVRVRKKMGVDPQIARGPYYHEDVEMLGEDSDEEGTEEEDDDEY